MPEKETMEAAREDLQEGKSASTAAGEFVREEVHHVREGKHGAKNTKQAIAIGLSKARRAGVKLGPPPAGSKRRTRQSAKSASRAAAQRRLQARLHAMPQEPASGIARPNKPPTRRIREERSPERSSREKPRRA